MKILFLDAYFYPENIAFSHLEKDILDGLINAGHDVTVVCPTPSRGIPDETIEKYKKIKKENINGVNVRRYWAPREGKNPLIRAFRYLWCNLRGNGIGKKYRDSQVVFAVSTPPTQGLFAGKLAKKLKVPFVYSLQDMFPESLVTSGIASRDSFVYKFGAKIEKKTYALCSKIIVLSKPVEESLLEKNVDASRLLTVSNWIDSEKVAPVGRDDNRLFDEFDVDKASFTVVYAGNFGASQGADVVLRAAQILKGNGDIRFVIFGGGSEFDQAKEYAEKNGLDNVTINPLLPAERVPEIYSMGDVALITCKKGVGKTALPSKLWSIMACNTPLIAAFDSDSELARIVAESGCGVCVEPENAEALAREIENRYIKKMTADIPSHERTPRDYVIEFASKEHCVSKYVSCIEDAMIS